MRVFGYLLVLAGALSGCGSGDGSDSGSGSAMAAPAVGVAALDSAAAARPALLDDAPNLAPAQAAALPPKLPPGSAPYLDGLDGLERADWSAAVKGFDTATDADDENGSYHLARAVALTFAERLDDVMPELQRAQRLGADDKSVRLWMATATAMKGDFMKANEFYSQATRDLFESDVRDMSVKYGEQVFRQGNRRPDTSRHTEKELQRMPEQMRDRVRQAEQEGRDDEESSNKEEDARTGAMKKAAVAQFPRLAHAYVARTKSANPALIAVLRVRAAERLQKGDYAGALADAQSVDVSQRDRQITYIEAVGQLHTGAPEGARYLFTQLLTVNPDDAKLYPMRALAEARLGSMKEAKRDVDTYLQLGGAKSDVAAANDAIAKADTPAARGDLAKLVGELQQLAMKGMSWDELVKRAETLIHSANAYRLRSDDRYQDRLRTLQNAARANPKNADAWAALGAFRYDEAVNVLGEKVEPRAVFRTFRLQAEANKQDELERGERSLDRALEINPKHVRALAYKAACRIYSGKWGDAETLLKKAIDLDRGDPIVLELFAQVLDHVAGIKAAKASNLRSTTTWEDSRYIYYRYPSQAELDAAAELEAEANRLWELARNALEQAVAANKGKFWGNYCEGVLARRLGDVNRATVAFEQATKLDPKHVTSHQQLSNMYAAQGRVDDAYAQQSIAVNLVDTSAAPMLKLAWYHVPRTAWKSAQKAVDGAMLANATDPRCAAYTGAITQQQPSEQAEAAGWFLAAAALGEAEARQRGISLRGAGGPNLVADDVGLLLAMKARTAALLVSLGRHDVAIKIAGEATALEPRLRRGELYTRSASAMLPEPLPDQFTVPTAPNPAMLFAELHLQMGNANVAANNPDAAMAEFARVRGYLDNKPPTMDVGSEVRTQYLMATLQMAKLLFAQKKIEEARHYMLQFGYPPGLPKGIVDEARRVEAQINGARQAATEDEYDNQWEQAEQQRKQQIEEFNRRRAETDRLRQQDQIKRQRSR